MELVIALIPLLPLAGFTTNILAGRRLGSTSAILATALLGASFVLSVAAFAKVWADPTPLTVTLFDWIAVGEISVQMGFAVDRLAAVMLLVVSGVGTLIHLYSIGYMHGDPRFSRFFAYMNLFAAMMLLLVVSDNLVAMFLGWEGVGLCSYLLIGFWYEKPFDKGTVGDAARKAFVVNRIGDFGFILGVFLLWVSYGTVSFAQLGAQAQAGLITTGVATLAGLLLFVGATGKSAQIPLYVWLPDAMAGPTPVSALIHAATMVTAGVYMIARTHFLFDLSALSGDVVLWIGAATAAFAATMALQQNDIKKILAYSTISQLGYMFMAAGIGAYALAIFHVMTHAFFKALLFLGAGAVIHALHEEQDVTKMGGLRDRLPLTYWTFLAGALALSGFPLTAGFFSKDAILESVFLEGNGAAWALGAATAGLTAFYTFRMVFLAFHGKYRGDVDHPHAPGTSMALPLVVLGVLSVIGGFVHIQAFHIFTGFGDFLSASVTEPDPHHVSAGLAAGLMAATLALVLGGIFLAWKLFAKPDVDAEAIAAEPSGIRKILRNKWYVDEIYDFLILSPITWFSRTVLWRVVDDWIIHGFLVQVCGGMLWKSVGFVVSFWQTGRVGTYAFGIVLGALMLIWILM